MLENSLVTFHAKSPTPIEITVSRIWSRLSFSHVIIGSSFFIIPSTFVSIASERKSYSGNSNPKPELPKPSNASESLGSSILSSSKPNTFFLSFSAASDAFSNPDPNWSTESDAPE